MALHLNKDTILLALGLLVTLFILDYLRLLLWNPLRNLPGPFSTRFSGLYRLSMVYSGNAPNNYRDLHNRYGKIVRAGPNHVSISDPSAIPAVYGLGTNYLKVRLIISNLILEIRLTMVFVRLLSIQQCRLSTRVRQWIACSLLATLHIIKL